MASFLLATYWHPQDYLVLDAAAAIMLAAGPLKTGVLAAMVVTVLSALAAPFVSHEMTIAWLLFAIVLLGLVGFGTLTRSRPPGPGSGSLPGPGNPADRSQSAAG